MELPGFGEPFVIAGARIMPHAVMELLAYGVGMRLYLRSRDRYPRGIVPFELQAWILVGCALGAMVGSKLLAIAESPGEYAAVLRASPLHALGGKTIVGGLLGGWAGVEIAKALLSVAVATGDAYALPLCAGMSIGRVGCFWAGLADHTCGLPTSLPWGVDFGDGPRHPTQLYEIAFLALLGTALALRRRRPHGNGALFLGFIGGYLAFRLAVDFLKPRAFAPLGLGMIQWACVVGMLVAAWRLRRLRAA